MNCFPRRWQNVGNIYSVFVFKYVEKIKQQTRIDKIKELNDFYNSLLD